MYKSHGNQILVRVHAGVFAKRKWTIECRDIDWSPQIDDLKPFPEKSTSVAALLRTTWFNRREPVESVGAFDRCLRLYQVDDDEWLIIKLVGQDLLVGRKTYCG